MNILKELALLEKSTPAQLRKRYAELFGETAHSHNRVWLIKRCLWRIQANAEGGLSERAVARAHELANDADLRTVPPKAKPADATPHAQTQAGTLGNDGANRLPPSGSVITRDYKGRTLRVTVLPAGFEFEGEVYKTLSSLAKHITGSHCNGFLFFRLNGGKVGAA